MKPLRRHISFGGMAKVIDGYPLYFDATNEYGLSIAGLRFIEDAKAHKAIPHKVNLAQFEIIPYILGTCKNVLEAMEILKKLVILDVDFSKEIPTSPLHFMIADKKQSYVIESLDGKVNIHENPYGVLTNSPSFPYHLDNVRLYMNLSNKVKSEAQIGSLNLKSFTSGQSTFGLPGDVTSPSRFIKATFLKHVSISEKSEEENVNQFIRILDNVSFLKGEAETQDNRFEYTIYSSCTNINKLLFYYKTYNNPTINCLDMKKLDVNKSELYIYPINNELVFNEII
jgi:choloylglycine hydrolase